ncbi:hypothetical protein F4859DRAFT_365164 [Xylaria cf. heliscus]|nr:hypothetical protein F4859DRAFT_365164 [Xylaria cf. heliscus]
MAPNQQTKTFTVPVGTRLSHGVELEMLVAYLHMSDVDPDGANSKNLPPILRIDAGDTDDSDDAASQETIEDIVEEHIRVTLRNHGIRVSAAGPPSLNANIPLHLHGLDQWDVTSDLSVGAGEDEAQLVRGKPGRYRWFGLELRSPACWDAPRAYDEIRFVINLMKSKYRVRVNLSCGLHVHVANGPRYYDPGTLKRAGAFFFAADPLLSRLHAPWRRIGPYSSSLRYTSRLATLDETIPIHEQMPTDAIAALFRAERPPYANRNREYLPEVPWSDRSREEKDFGGRAKGGMMNWERYASERVRDGPYITLNERPPTPESSAGSERSSPRPQNLSKSTSSSSNNDSDDDNEGGAHYRHLLRLMGTPGFRASCLRRFNHEHPEILSSTDQYTLLVLNRCEYLFGHSSVNLLSDSQYYDLTVACAPYIEAARSSWEWNSDTNEFTLKDAPIGTSLEHPRPRTLRQTNGRQIVLGLQALAEIQEAEGELRAAQQGEGDIAALDDDDEPDEITGTNDFREMFYNTIDRLMVQPTFPLDNIESLLAELPDSASEASKATTDSSGGFNPSASQALAAAYPIGNTGAAPSGPSGSSGSESSDASGAGSNGSTSRGAFSGLSGFGLGAIPSNFNNPSESRNSDNHQGSGSAPDSSPFISNVSSVHQNNRIARGPKLRPHDVYQLPDSYIFRISNRYSFAGPEWRRIPWLPFPGGPPDPAEDHPRGSCPRPDCLQHVVTETRAGVATILGLDSGAAVAELLVPSERGDRANYNLMPYESEILFLGGDKRTIEFREAGGSLDADWILTWIRVCVGILRFCRDASVADFIDVLERVVREEERQRVTMRGPGDEDMYDVCDLLEDLCLFAEATIIRQRERDLGPPR